MRARAVAPAAKTGKPLLTRGCVTVNSMGVPSVTRSEERSALSLTSSSVPSGTRTSDGKLVEIETACVIGTDGAEGAGAPGGKGAEARARDRRPDDLTAG